MTASASDCEFLVFRLAAEGKTLARITREGVFNGTRAYIGDAAAYKLLSQLQRPYFAPRSSTFNNPTALSVSSPWLKARDRLSLQKSPMPWKR